MTKLHKQYTTKTEIKEGEFSIVIQTACKRDDLMCI